MKIENQNKFSLFHRSLHWVMALAMPVLYLTGFLRMYWMNKNQIVEIIASKTSAIPKEQMVDIAKSIRAPMWQWHEWFSYIIIISFVARIIYMITKGIRFQNPFKSKQPLKERLQGFTYVYFYLFIAILAITGICMQQNLFPAWKGTIESLHKLGIYFFPIFIVLHFAGIIIAEVSDKKGITSKMIGGE